MGQFVNQDPPAAARVHDVLAFDLDKVAVQLIAAGLVAMEVDGDWGQFEACCSHLGQSVFGHGVLLSRLGVDGGSEDPFLLRRGGRGLQRRAV
jgi:hypothetical protein